MPMILYENFPYSISTDNLTTFLRMVIETYFNTVICTSFFPDIVQIPMSGWVKQTNYSNIRCLKKYKKIYIAIPPRLIKNELLFDMSPRKLCYKLGDTFSLNLKYFFTLWFIITQENVLEKRDEKPYLMYATHLSD